MAINKFFATGNLVRAPEYSKSNNGVSVCKFSIAVSRKFKQEGETDVDYFNIITFRGQADNCSKYLNKGSKVLVIGSVQNRSYTANDGTKRYVTEVIAEEVEFLSPKSTEPVNTEASRKQEIMQGFVPIESDNLPFD